MKNLLIILTISLFASCRCNKPAVSEKETITVRETIRDTTVIVEPDVSMLQALLECDENRNVVIRQLTELQSGVRLKPPQMTMRNNVLTVVAQVDSFGVYVAWKERETEKVRTVTVTEKVNELTTWQWFQVWLGRILAAWLIIVLIFNFLKK